MLNEVTRADVPALFLILGGNTHSFTVSIMLALQVELLQLFVLKTFKRLFQSGNHSEETLNILISQYAMFSIFISLIEF